MSDLATPSNSTMTDENLDETFKSSMDVFIRQLHQSLDFHQLLDVFAQQARKLVPCDGIEYKEDETSLYFIDGVLAAQGCCYEINYHDRSLGQICFTRDHEFSSHELSLIENLAAGLTLPLRNALKYEQAIKMAQRDSLTGLRNSHFYHDSVELEIERAHRYNIPFSLIMLDIDNFQQINDVYTYQAGDAVLVELASRVERDARSSDVVFRTTGDRFMIFLPNTYKPEAIKVAERLKASILNTEFRYTNEEIGVTLSAGVVSVLPDDNAYQLMDRADKALFHAKIQGKNRVCAEASSASIHREWQ